MEFFAVYQATRDAIVHARSQGPVLLEMKVERYMPHTTDDDDRRYRPAGEVEAARLRDPILGLRSYLFEKGLLTESQDEELRAQAKAEVDEATETAMAAGFPDPSTIHTHVYAP